MICRYKHPMRCLLIFMSYLLVCSHVPAQDKLPILTKPINLDDALREQTPPDRAASYYYFALSKWNERNGDLLKAISQMQEALDLNRDSSTVHLELAALLEKNGDILKAISHAEEASRLDPTDPEPHWLLANIYFKNQARNSFDDEGLQKAVQELEKFRDLSPDDGRVYYALGGAYFELNQPEKAIQAYEKFQSIITSTDSGYREIAKYYAQTDNIEKAVSYLQKGIELRPDSAESMIMLGELYSKLRRSQDAIPIYRKLLDVTGNNVTVKRQLALSLIESGEYAEAAVLLKEILDTVPGNSDAQILLGRAQIGSQDYPKAIETLLSVRASNPETFLNAQFYLGIAYENSEMFPDAIKVFSNLLNKLPSDSAENQSNRLVFQQHLAFNYLEIGENEKAIELYAGMIKSDPKMVPKLMNAYRLNLQYDEAIRLGKQEFEKNQGDVRLGILYARILADAGKPGKGAQILTQLLQSAPSDVDIYIHLSQIYMQDNHFSEAEKILRQAKGKELEGEKAGERLSFQLAIVYEKQKQYDRAESLLSDIVKTSPEDMDAKFYLANVYERQKKYDRAESLFKEIIKTNPKNAGALNYIGYMLADLGIRLEEAVQYVKDALVIDPENGAYLDSLGWAYFKLNDMEKAEKYLLQADQRVKDDPVIYDHLGDFYHKAGDYRKARDYWMQSIRIGTEQEDIQKIRRKINMLPKKLQK
jgi:tetratricopeptide (TPR) repeat protein